MPIRKRIDAAVHDFTEVRQALQQIDHNFRITPTNNFSATSDPTVNDDEKQGYSGGSFWYNTAGNSLWICESATPGMAVWVNVTGSGGSVGADAFAVITPDSGGDVVADAAADTLTLAGGTGVATVGTPGSDTITLNTVDSEINHDALLNFVSNEHVDHTGVTLTLTQTADETSVTSSGSPLDISASRSWTIGIADNPILPGTGSVTIPIGTTAQRPGTPVNGMVRYNAETESFEFRENSAWVSFDPLPASSGAWGLVLSDSPTGWDGHQIGSVIWTDISWTAGRLVVSGGSTGTRNEVPAPSAAGQALVSTAIDPFMGWVTPPYPILAGVAGGQTLFGGTAASEILTLEGTSHATDGRVYVRDSDLALDRGKFLMLTPDLGSAVSISYNNSTGDIEYNTGSGNRHLFNRAVQLATGASLSILSGNLTVDTNVLFVDSVNDRIGVKTTAPTGTISIVDEIASAVRGIHTYCSVNNVHSGKVGLYKSRGTFASPTACASGDHGGVLNCNVHDGTAYRNPATILFVVNGAVSTSNVPVDIQFYTGVTDFGTLRLLLPSGGDVLIGTTTVPTGTRSKCLVFGDNAGNPTPGTNTAGIFAKDVAGTVEMFVVDEGGVATQISPHDPATGRWVHDSVNLRTGKRTYIDMERAMEILERLSGERIIERTVAA